MTINYDVKKLTEFGVSNGYAPDINEGPRTIPVFLDFSTDAQTYVDFTVPQMGGAIGQIQSLIIDNTQNAFPLTILLKQTNHRIVIPAQTEACRPVASGTPFQALFSSTVSAAPVSVQCLNVPLAPYTYGPLTVNATAGAVTGTYVDRSGTIAVANTSQAMMAGNALRKGLYIENPTTEIESLWINFTTPAVQSQPSIELTPGGIFNPSNISTEAIHVIATTAGHTFIAKELQ